MSVSQRTPFFRNKPSELKMSQEKKDFVFGEGVGGGGDRKHFGFFCDIRERGAGGGLVCGSVRCDETW